MADMMDKVATARASGYSDDEIIQFLSSKGDMSPKIKQAQDAGYAPKDIIDHLVSKVPAASTGPKDATQIESNPQWAARGKLIYKADKGEDFKGTDQDAAKWLKDYIYDFNNRLIGTGTDTGRGTVDIAYNLSNYTPEAKKAFVDAQNDYENMGYSWKGAGEVAKRIITDPTTYLGLGVGKIFTKGAEEVGKKGVVELAKIGAKQSAKEAAKVGAVEGAAYTGASDIAKQAGMINSGGQESFDPLQTVESAGIGALGGGALGAGVGAITGGLAGRKPIVQAARQLVDNPEEARMAAEATQRIADIQATRDVPIALADVNQSADLLRTGIVRDVKQLGTPKEDVQRLSESLIKSRGISDEEAASLQGLQGGQQVVDNIQFLKKLRDMTQPVEADKGVIKKGLRTALDYAPVPKVAADAIKYAFLNPRKTGTEVIRDAISPRNLEIAKNVTELGGPSQATIGRETLTSMAADAVRAQKLAKDALEQARLEKAYSFKERALDAVKRNDPPVPDSPQGVMEDATGMDRTQVAQALRIVERTRPLLKAQADQYRKSVATGGRIEDFNALIRAVRKLGDEGLVPRSREPNSGSQVMMQGVANAAYSPAMAQANANQARVTQSIGRIASEALPEVDKQAINTAIAMVGKTNNRQEAIQIQLDLVNGMSSPEAKAIAMRELAPLIAQIRHEKPKGK